MGALGEELMDTITVLPEASVAAEALHSVFTVDACELKVTLVLDSLPGNGPAETDINGCIKLI